MIAQQLPVKLLSSSEVVRCLPTTAECIDIVEETFADLALGDVDMPPKPVLVPREGAFVHPMCAFLHRQDVLGLKWVSGYPSNRALGLPYILGVVLVCDAATGAVKAIMDGGAITAVRTASVTGMVLRHVADREIERVAIVGTGVQARYHVPVITNVLGDVELVVFDSVQENASVFAEWASRQESVRGVKVAASVFEAIGDSDVVITGVPTTGTKRRDITRASLKDRCVLVPLDWDSLVSGDVVKEAGVFLVDDLSEYHYYHERGSFAGYPEPRLSYGDLALAERQASNQSSAGAHHDERLDDDFVVATALGAGGCDMALAHRILLAADEMELGTEMMLWEG